MALGFPFGFRVAAAHPLDNKYGPYVNTAAAIAAVLAGERYVGLTVNVAGVEYWWKDGVGDGDLIEKSGSDHFKGYYTTLLDLNTAHPIAEAGDYAIVDAGVGNDAQKYIWDTNDNEWIISGGAPVAFASETQEGTVEEGTQAEVNDSEHSGTGTTGARLFVSIPKLWGWWNVVKATLTQTVTANIAGDVVVDLSTARTFILTLTGNVTSFSFVNAEIGKEYIFVFKQGAVAYTINWAANMFRFPFGNAPILTDPTLNGSAPASAVDIVTGVCVEADILSLVFTPDLIRN